MPDLALGSVSSELTLVLRFGCLASYHYSLLTKAAYETSGKLSRNLRCHFLEAPTRTWGCSHFLVANTAPNCSFGYSNRISRKTLKFLVSCFHSQHQRLTWLENIFSSPIMGPLKFMNKRFGFGTPPLHPT